MQRVPSESAKETDVVSTLTAEEDQLTNEPYFLGNIDAEAANRILDSIGKERAFLVRSRQDSAVPYALSVFFEGRVRHFRIYRDAKGMYSVESRDVKKPKKYTSMLEILDFLEENDMCNCQISRKYVSDVGTFKNNAGHVPEKPLTATVSRKKSIDTPKSECGLNDLPYFLKDGNREYAYRILKEIKQEGVFYIYRTRGPEKNTHPYEMAVYNETTVEYLPIKSSSYEHFSIEPNSELNFKNLPSLVRHYNYEFLRLNPTRKIKLRIYCRYRPLDEQPSGD